MKITHAYIKTKGSMNAAISRNLRKTVTGIPATPSESLAELTKRETAWYGKERDWQLPIMRLVLTLAF